MKPPPQNLSVRRLFADAERRQQQDIQQQRYSSTPNNNNTLYQSIVLVNQNNSPQTVFGRDFSLVDSSDADPNPCQKSSMSQKNASSKPLGKGAGR
jgi:hypothetical protein